MRNGLHQYLINNGSSCYVGLVTNSGHVMFYICAECRSMAYQRRTVFLALAFGGIAKSVSMLHTVIYKIYNSLPEIF